MIVLDVTCGSGAFMKDYKMAKELAEAMIKIGNLAGRKTVAVITDMDQPLGRFCGNILEMQEVFDTVTGKGEEDVIEVVTELAFHPSHIAQLDEEKRKQLEESQKEADKLKAEEEAKNKAREERRILQQRLLEESREKAAKEAEAKVCSYLGISS